MPSVYVISVMPETTPVTRPEDELTVAMPTSWLLHIPEPVISVKVVVVPVQIVVLPLMAPGNGLMVITVDVKQLVGSA